MNPESIILVVLSVFVLAGPATMVAVLAYAPRVLPHLRRGVAARAPFPRPSAVPFALPAARVSPSRRPRPGRSTARGDAAAAAGSLVVVSSSVAA